MKSDREVWFQRAMVGGWNPIHPKGYALLFGALGTIYFPGASSALVISFRGPRILAIVFILVAIFVGVATWILSFLHSRPWADRDKPLAKG